MPNLPAYTTSLGNPTGYARTIASKIIRDLHQNQQILLANSEDLLDHDASVNALAVALSRVMHHA